MTTESSIYTCAHPLTTRH